MHNRYSKIDKKYNKWNGEKKKMKHECSYIQIYIQVVQYHYFNVQGYWSDWGRHLHVNQCKSRMQNIMFFLWLRPVWYFMLIMIYCIGSKYVDLCVKSKHLNQLRCICAAPCMYNWERRDVSSSSGRDREATLNKSALYDRQKKITTQMKCTEIKPTV